MRTLPRQVRLVGLLTLAVVWLMSTPAIADAAAIQEGESITIRSGETISDDVYAFGTTVDVEGRIDGDLIAFGSVVSVDGEVTGDVITGSSDVRISGKVGGSVRAGTGTLSVTGDIAEDLVAGSGRVRIGSNGTIGRDVLAGAGMMEVDGTIERDVRAGTGSLVVAGRIGGDADISSGDIRFASGGRVEGDLVYRSDREQDIPTDAVEGRVTFRETPTGGQERKGTAGSLLFWFFNWLRGLIGMALLTLFVTLLFPLYSLSSAEEIRLRPLPSLGIGLALFFGVPVLAGFVFVIGIIVGGWWLGLALMALYLIALAVGVVIAAVFLGVILLGALKSRPPRAIWAGLLGLFALWLVRLVPVLGSLLLFVAMVFGLGAAALALWDTARRCRANTAAAPPEPLV